MNNWIKKISISLLIVLFSFYNVFSYSTHSGDFSLDDMFNKVSDWLEEIKPEEVNNDNYNVKTHPWLALQSINLFEQYYSITLTPEIKREIIIGAIEEDFDIVNTSIIQDYSHLETSEILDILSPGNVNVNRAENHFMIIS